MTGNKWAAIYVIARYIFASKMPSRYIFQRVARYQG